MVEGMKRRNEKKENEIKKNKALQHYNQNACTLTTSSSWISMDTQVCCITEASLMCGELINYNVAAVYIVVVVVA
jgi:hypothetical protein